jgi:hypothetical protein
MDEIKKSIENYISTKNYRKYFKNVRVKENGYDYTVYIDYENLTSNKLLKALEVDKNRKYTNINYSSNEIFIDVKSALNNPGLKEITDFLYFAMLP